MKKEAFQEIAKHFAESIKVTLRFEAGATPSTNGREIVLPTEMSEAYLDETLGALLHETNHIRYTDMNYFTSLDGLSRHVGNVVEDIRVDSKALKAYPNSKCFYMKLVDDVIKNNGYKLRQEIIAEKVLKSLILMGFGVDVALIYDTCEDWDKMQVHLKNLSPLLNDIKKCPDMQALNPIILQIIKELFKQDPNDKQQKAKAKKPTKECNGGQGGEAIEDDSDEGSSDEDTPSKEEEAQEKVSENLDEFEQKQEELEKVKEEHSISQVKSNAHANTYNKALRSKKCYNTKLRNLRYSSDPDKVEKEKKYTTAIQERTEILEKERKQWGEAQDKQRITAQDVRKTEGRLEELKEEMNTLADIMFSKSDVSSLLGFNALDKDKLLDKNYVDIPYNQCLDELIKEVLILKQEEYQQEETGKLNLRRLHEVFTEPDNMFVEKDTRQILTRVTFVVDVSGSMDSFASAEDRRNDLCSHALNIVASSFKKAILANAPGEMKIYAFGDKAVETIPSADQFSAVSPSVLLQWRDKAGGSTNLSRCVNLIVNEVTSDPEYRNILVIITDAEVDSEELQEMTNNISTGDVKVLYIAIGSGLHTPEAQELFGQNNITNKENAVKILQDVMMQGMYMVN